MNEAPSELISADVTAISEIQEPLIYPQLLKDSSRVDVEMYMSEFREDLGPGKWEEYRDALSHFLMGKLSRAELVHALRETVGLRGTGMRNHNTLIESLLANCYRDLPPGTESNLAKWKSGSKVRSRYAGLDAANNRLHRDILTLPVSERRRIKNIAKEYLAYMKSPLLKPTLPAIVETRQKLLPHIPYNRDPSKSYDLQNSQSMVNSKTSSELNSPNPVTKAIAASKLLKESKREMELSSSSSNSNSQNQQNQQNQSSSSLTTGSSILYDPGLNLQPALASGPLTWKQDIIQAFDTPMASEMHELSDNSHLGQRMLGVALENGIVQGLGVGAVDIVQAGLETYLRSVIDQLVELKHRKFSSENPLSAEDLCLFADTRPTEMGEPSGPLYRMHMNYLQDTESPPPPPIAAATDDYATTAVSASDNDKKRKTPLDFPIHSKPKIEKRSFFKRQYELRRKANEINELKNKEKSKHSKDGNDDKKKRAVDVEVELIEEELKQEEIEDAKEDAKEDIESAEIVAVKKNVMQEQKNGFNFIQELLSTQPID